MITPAEVRILLPAQKIKTMEYWKQHLPDDFETQGGWIQNWFSNMRRSPIVIDGIEYAAVENYFQSHKSLDPSEHIRISQLAPNISKREGRKLALRPDWEEVKYDVMMTALRAKFSQPYWRKLLLDTGDETIIEWNNWNDRIWGVSITDCLGYNLLGKALMEIREELRH